MITKGKSLSINAGIYTSHDRWSNIVGLDWTYPADQGLPLWYFHDDQDASFSDFSSFGGWKSPYIKQYYNSQKSCAVGVDYDYIDTFDLYEQYKTENPFQAFLQD